MASEVIYINYVEEGSWGIDMKMESIHKLECTILTKSHNLRKKKKSSHTISERKKITCSLSHAEPRQ